MSRRHATDSELAELHFPCMKCGARPDQWCLTRTGRQSTGLHSARWGMVRAVIRLAGWEEWVEDEQARARMFRQQRDLLVGGTVALQGELRQVADRGCLAPPALLIERIDTILAAAKEITHA